MLWGLRTEKLTDFVPDRGVDRGVVGVPRGESDPDDCLDGPGEPGLE